jgi:hypothetical protein
LLEFTPICPLSRERNFNSILFSFAGEGGGEGMSRMVIDDALWASLKELRRIATRYDKTARMYLTGIMFVSILK